MSLFAQIGKMAADDSGPTAGSGGLGDISSTVGRLAALGVIPAATAAALPVATLAGGAYGAGSGGLEGAIRGAGQGAVRTLGIGGGGFIGGALGNAIGDSNMDPKRRLLLTLLGAGAGAGLGHAATDSMFSRSNKVKNLSEKQRLAKLEANEAKAEKEAALDPAVANALGLGGIGAAAGGVLGSISGFADPGHDEEVIGEDENGRKIIRKVPKSRLAQALGSGLGGALAGGLGGAALGGLGTEAMRYVPKVQNMIKREQSKDHPLGMIDRGLSHVGDSIWDMLPREGQHSIMSQKVPMVYDNPLSRGANTAVDKLMGYMGKK
jgi:hypothetical protein